MTTALHWFRRDLRISDNTALNLAVKEHGSVVPVYVVSAWRRHRWCGARRQEFLCGCLASLQRNLERKGGRLVVRSGPAAAALEKLVRESGATAIYFNRDPDPFGRAAEEQVSRMAGRLGVRVVSCQDHALHERDEVLTGEGKPYRVFTPYARNWSHLEKRAPGRTLARIDVPAGLASEPLPSLAHWGLASSAQIVTPGEAAARGRLGKFLDEALLHYAERRDLPGEEGTSRLSQDLRHGTLSIREVYAKCQAAAASARTVAAKASAAVFVNELIWREFYFQVLRHWPEVLEHEFQEDYRALAWRARWRPENEGAWTEDPRAKEDFARWCEGQTGFPIVDAGMRQLEATGFMHNRVRMIVAMFLAKDLRLWWMHGESHFMQRLVDGEIASNNGGWQWSASTGTDAAPYFRIQNPWSQTKRYDPKGDYIKRWVPELRDVTAARLCAPPPGGQALAKGYSRPMVDHAAAREKVLELFRGV